MKAESPFTVAGVQQVGIGVRDAAASFTWYRRNFGFDVRIFDDTAEAQLMRRYTGGEIQRRRAILAVNMAGGGGLEIWQFVNREPQASPIAVSLGDLGIFATRLKTSDVKRAFDFLRSAGVDVFSAAPECDPAGVSLFFVRDPHGNIFTVSEHGSVFDKRRHPIGGVAGAILGVSDIDRSAAFYRETLGYDRIVFDRTGVFDGLAPLPGGGSNIRWIRLARSAPFSGAFSRLLGPAEIDLVQSRERPARRIYDGRCWGDCGFIHMCFDVRGSDAVHARAAALGFPATVDSANSFDMGEAAGRFSYIEDPDGTLIELVETHRVPIIKKLGLSIDLRKRPPGRALPDWIVRGLALNRVKD